MSIIKFRCPACKRSFQVPASMARTQARCTACGTVVTVPAPRQPTKISFRCPQCGKAFHVSPDWAGKQARCAACQAIMAVPGGRASTGVDPLDRPSALPAYPTAGADDFGSLDAGVPLQSMASRTLGPASAEYGRPRKAGGGFRLKKWMVAVGWLGIWAFFTLVGLGSADFQMMIFKVGSYICIPVILLSMLVCVIQVVVKNPLGALTMLFLGGVAGPLAGPFTPRVGRMARNAGVPGVDTDQQMGWPGTLLVAASAAETLLLINVLLVYVL